MDTLASPMPVYNVDGTPNQRGPITKCVHAMTRLGNKSYPVKYFVTALGDQDIILGFSWLQQYNPIIDWKAGTALFANDEPRSLTTFLQ